MNATRFKDLCAGYGRLVESHARLLSLVGLERRERLVADPIEAARALGRAQSAAWAEETDGDQGEDETSAPA